MHSSLVRGFTRGVLGCGISVSDGSFRVRVGVGVRWTPCFFPAAASTEKGRGFCVCPVTLLTRGCVVSLPLLFVGIRRRRSRIGGLPRCSILGIVAKYGNI